jgi:branched-subunit amino acid permease
MKPHRFDTVSFIAGLLFTALGLLFLIPQTPEQLVDMLLDSGAWFWPVLLVAIGLAVIIPAILPKAEVEPEAAEAIEAD